MNSLQEKFQITVPPTSDDVEGWSSWSDARKTGEAGFLHQNNTDPTGPIGPKFNQLPPGMEINNQLRTRVTNNIPLAIAGSTDVSKDTSDQSLIHGFTRREMKGTDDQCTGEHMDHFYGVAYGFDPNGKIVEGFSERNNYLDRM